jgi:glucosylceramidase
MGVMSLYRQGKEVQFILDHLYPVLVNQGLEKIKIIAWDHNRDRLIQRANDIYAKEEV